MDAIDRLASIEPGSFLDALRQQKPVTRDNAQASFDALFAPGEASEMSIAERAAVAAFVAALHEDDDGIAFYRQRLPASGVTPAQIQALEAEAVRAAGSGPYGSYPAGPLSVEDTPGPHYTPDASDALGPRLTAALAHVHLLVFRPRDAAAEHLRALEAAGWSATGIVTLSQLVAFLSFQLRAAAGLRALDRSRA